MKKTESMSGYAIGEQDFASLREMNCVYVDKTMYIRRLLDNKSKYIFLARPRRFGKSLFLSTLRYFFEGRRDLFKGLSVDDADWNWDWPRHPVLYLDLNPMRYDGPGHLDSHLDNIFTKWEEEYGLNATDRNISTRFSNIIETAYRFAGRQVVILVDEYDKPLVSNLTDDEAYEKYRAQLAALYANFKSSAPYIRMVFLTGVSRFGRLSVFSDLNNLNDISFDDEYADICGITEPELIEYFTDGIQKLAEKESLSSEVVIDSLREHYDGYRFAIEGSDIYNPWSILMCMLKGRIGFYWTLTGIPKIVADALHDRDIDLESILNTECDLFRLQGLDLSNLDPLALLYQTGYLTIKHYDDEVQLARLGVPNKEVTQGLFNVLANTYLTSKNDTAANIVAEIIRCLRRGQPEELVKNLDSFFAGIPYEMKMQNENNLHNCIYILLRLIGVNVKTEVHTSDGRIDLLVDTEKYIYIIELKFGKASETAHSQIESKDYALPYRRDSRTVFRIGLNFNPLTRHLDEPKISEG